MPAKKLPTWEKFAGSFRPKKLDLSGFVNTRLIRDHNKRMAVERTEPARYELLPHLQLFEA